MPHMHIAVVILNMHIPATFCPEGGQWHKMVSSEAIIWQWYVMCCAGGRGIRTNGCGLSDLHDWQN
jgi:hypothetical protein